jgi:hypothetical protein
MPVVVVVVGRGNGHGVMVRENPVGGGGGMDAIDQTSL